MLPNCYISEQIRKRMKVCLLDDYHEDARVVSEREKRRGALGSHARCARDSGNDADFYHARQCGRVVKAYDSKSYIFGFVCSNHTAVVLFFLARVQISIVVVSAAGVLKDLASFSFLLVSTLDRALNRRRSQLLQTSICVHQGSSSHSPRLPILSNSTSP